MHFSLIENIILHSPLEAFPLLIKNEINYNKVLIKEVYSFNLSVTGDSNECQKLKINDRIFVQAVVTNCI